ncbi:hypothetical protein [Companilactobacillus keshanensis]|uniref:Competence protein n=1 Tax=Companilactobacillus keshanensis TaxID=2486003 RepID=A0ABW4BVA5_9LACO|nr:hypothetical protein [Companilactobacillus keshanensis]
MDNIYQFSNQVIDKKWLLSQGIKLLYINDDFVADRNIVALLDIKDLNIVHGKSLVVHNTKGVFIVERTTKQIMNEFHQTNRVGFMISRVLSNYFNFKHYLPMVHGNVSYMPMTGGSRNNADWIGLHFIEDFRQIGKVARFKSTQGFEIEMDFPKGNLSSRLHDVSVMAEYFVSSTMIYMESMNLKVVPMNNNSILNAFSTCLCPRHDKMPHNYRDIGKGVNYLTDSILLKMCRGELGYRETKIIYTQRINKIKRNY